jgi:hypothetical protein
MLEFLQWIGLSDPNLQERAITGIFSFVGVLITGLIAIGTWLGNQVVTRRASRRLREERRRDVQTALLAEIEAILMQRSAIGDYDELAKTLERRFQQARESSDNYTPYVTPETGALVFEALKDDISILEEKDIRPVVRFYRQIQVIEDFAGELKTDRFYALDLDRKERMTLHYVRMLGTALAMAQEALEVLAESLGVPPTTVQSLNNRGQDRTHQA